MPLKATFTASSAVKVAFRGFLSLVRSAVAVIGLGGLVARTYAGVAPEQRRAERRERLLAAALDLFTTTGYQQAKIADLCTSAGVSTRNFYEEFASKEQVLLTLHEQINERAMSRV